MATVRVLLKAKGDRSVSAVAVKHRFARRKLEFFVLIHVDCCWHNDQDQPVAATDFPMCAQPLGNSAASYCSLAFDLFAVTRALLRALDQYMGKRRHLSVPPAQHQSR
jgi:hypothetical protein